jgi:hypothetical protein
LEGLQEEPDVDLKASGAKKSVRESKDVRGSKLSKDVRASNKSGPSGPSGSVLRESAAEMVNLEGVNGNPDMLTLNNSLSNIHLDKEALAQRDEEAQFLRQLDQEKLPGMVKSKWALTYKLKMDKAIEDALDHEEEVAEKVKTKGRFQIQACTNAGNWIRDR